MVVLMKTKLVHHQVISAVAVGAEHAFSAGLGHIRAHQQTNFDDANTKQFNQICNGSNGASGSADFDSVAGFHTMQALQC